MNVIQLINIFKRHLLLLLSIPILLSSLVFYLTKNPTYEYESSTVIYTGIASGYNLEQKEKFDLFGSRNAFDNLINVIKSRETLSETAIRLFALTLSLDSYNKTIISRESFIDLRKKTPQHIKDMVVKPIFTNDSVAKYMAYEQTVQRFIEYKNASDTNYIYNLLNYKHIFFSIKSISSVRVNRVQSSDLIELKYKTIDPGITIQTLKILTDVFIKNFRSLKENQSDAVVSYFEKQVRMAQSKLGLAEDDLLEFNKGNKIINYYEQSKFIASKKEEIEVSIQNERMKMSGAEQSLINIENKLQVQGQIQGISDEIVTKRNRLIDITEKLTINEIYNAPDTATKNELTRLKAESSKIEGELNQALNQLYSFGNSIDGLPLDALLSEWLKNLIRFAEAKAGLKVLLTRQEEFKKNYDLFAPLGANISRIEREINVAEREYLSLLQSLNEAKLKQQNEQLSSNIKPLDPPYFPISPLPSKRKILIAAAGIFGFIMVAFTILFTEYFDNTIKNLGRAEKLTGLKPIGLMPKIIARYKNYNMPFITNRLIELLLQEIKYFTTKQEKVDQRRQSRIIIVFSNAEQEGKTFMVSKLVDKLRTIGDRVLFMNYSFVIDQLVDDKKKEITREKKFINILSNPFSLIQSSGGKKKNEELLETIQNKDNITYQVDNSFPDKQDLFDLIPNQEINSFDNYNYVFLELPSIINHLYPSALISQGDMSISIVRSNREWKKADTNALEMLEQYLSSKPMLFLNGTEIEETEGLLGTLPKKRSKFRKMMKQLVKLQFYTKSSIR